MGLFSKDESFKEYEQFKKARQDFKEANAEMTDTIDLKTSDAKNVNYAEIHTSIYQNVGLGKDWRVGKNKNADELETAIDGFNTVTDGLEPYPDKSIKSKNILQVVVSFFKK